MHRADYRLFPDLRLICIIYSGDIDGNEIADHLRKVIISTENIQSWNFLIDLRSFIGNIHHSALERLARLTNEKSGKGPLERTLEKRAGRVAVVSYNAGQQFMVNLARVYIRGYDLRYFSDMRQGYAWAAGRDALPADMRSLDWHLGKGLPRRPADPPISPVTDD